MKRGESAVAVHELLLPVNIKERGISGAEEEMDEEIKLKEMPLLLRILSVTVARERETRRQGRHSLVGIAASGAADLCGRFPGPTRYSSQQRSLSQMSVWAEDGPPPPPLRAET